MKTKKGSILDELKFNQLSRESESKIISGKSIWDYNWSTCTPTGKLYHYIDDAGISHLVLDKQITDLNEIIACGDNWAAPC
jgi:hypothetical protein